MRESVGNCTIRELEGWTPGNDTDSQISGPCSYLRETGECILDGLPDETASRVVVRISLATPPKWREDEEVRFVRPFGDNNPNIVVPPSCPRMAVDATEAMLRDS